MEFIIGIMIMFFIIYKLFVKDGNIDFWKFISRDPETAYTFFCKNDCFKVFEDVPVEGFKARLPDGEWDGPFKIFLPSKNKTITIYGLVPRYKIEQEKFISKMRS